MSASDELDELRASLDTATRALSKAAARLEALEATSGKATVITRRWRRRDTTVAAVSSLGTAILLALVGLAWPSTHDPAPVVATVAPKAEPPIRSEPPVPPPEPVVTVTPPEPPPVVVEAPKPHAPVTPVKPVVATKPPPPPEPVERDPFRGRRHEASDVF